MRTSTEFLIAVCASFLFSLIYPASSTQLWSGNFDFYASSFDLDAWSWDNRVGQWQSYIHGQNVASDWIELSPSFKNPSDTISRQGAKIKTNGNAIWAIGGPNMLRNEIIPEGFGSEQQTGTLFYQWSIKQTSSHQLNAQYEHQLVFFENHFADLKYGGDGGSNLYFLVNGVIVWRSPFTEDTWFNFALSVNYRTGQISLFQSTQGNPLVQVVAPIYASAAQADWHVGHLRLPLYSQNNYQNPAEEWLFYSTISIQNSLLQPFGSSSSTSSTSSTSTSTSTSSTTSISSQTSGRIIPQSMTTASVAITPSLTSSSIIRSTTGSVISLIATTGSVPIVIPSSGSSIQQPSCISGHMKCLSSNTYSTCDRESWGVSQNCYIGTVCSAVGGYIYCLPSNSVAPLPTPVPVSITTASVTTATATTASATTASATTAAAATTAVATTAAATTASITVPSTTSSSTTSFSSNVCLLGDQQCITSNSYRTCSNGRDGPIWSSAQFCREGLSCHPSNTANNIYCY